MKFKVTVDCLLVLLAGLFLSAQAMEKERDFRTEHNQPRWNKEQRLTRGEQYLTLEYTLEYLEMYRQVAHRKNVSPAFINRFSNWFLTECSFSAELVYALITREDEVATFNFNREVISQLTFQNISQSKRMVLRPPFRVNKPMLVDGPVTGGLLDKPGEALYIVSLLWKHFPDVIEEYHQTVIAYAVVWDAAVHINLRGKAWNNHTKRWQSVRAPGGPEEEKGYYYTPDEYIVSHFRMFGSWNEKEELVFDLRELSWQDIAYIISTGRLFGNGSVIKYPLEDIEDIHDMNWHGKRRSYKDFLEMDWPRWRIRRYQSKFELSAYPWNAAGWNCGCISQARRIVSQCIGIPAAESIENIRFYQPHGAWPNGNPRWSLGHYMTAYKRTNDGQWYFGIGALEYDVLAERYDSDYDGQCNIPAGFTFPELEGLPPQEYTQNDISMFKVAVRSPQIASEQCIFYWVDPSIVNENNSRLAERSR